jgi:predicted N-acyltransferase
MARFKHVGSITQLSRSQWQALRDTRYPFLDYDFLVALEQTQCVGTDSGWIPAYFAAFENQQLIAAMPAFIKEHSYGEYVFDWSWADAYQRNGLAYYPKLLAAIPFTPVTGPRLIGDQFLWPEALTAISEYCLSNRLSGWHINFLDNNTLTHVNNFKTGKDQEALIRTACQFHWYNREYRNFEHYLEQFTSRKRKSVRKERDKIAAQGIRITRLTHKQITPEHIAFFYQCYQITYLRRRSQGYLNQAFFQQLRDVLNSQLMLVLAHKDDQPIAAALCFYDDDNLYGRYWGAIDDVDALHFEACYYQGIEFCIEQGIKHFDPGTQGEHKISRGFEPILTHSAHWLVHPQFHDAVAHFLAEEGQHILAYQGDAKTLQPFREGFILHDDNEAKLV